jgi:cbb3-type cytochrome oxidase subunit 3
MKALIISRTDLLLLPEVAFVIFVSVFVGALWLVLRPGAKAAYARHASMALDESEREDTP